MGAHALSVDKATTSLTPHSRAAWITFSAPSMFVLGLIHFRRGEYEQAQELFEQYQILSPDGKYISETNDYIINIRLIRKQKSEE